MLPNGHATGEPDAYAVATKAPSCRAGQPLERLGRRLWRFADRGLQRGGGPQDTKATRLSRRDGGRLEGLSGHLARLRAKARRHWIFARQRARQRLCGAVPGRRLCQAGYRSRLSGG
jgi:hypothetical protein